MAKQKITIGSVIQIEIGDDYYAYGQILGKSSVAIFDLKNKGKLQDLSILESTPVLFIITVYDNAITQGRWEKIGKLDLREDFNELPMQFIQDALNSNSFELYNPNTGDIKPVLREECYGLECAAVWEAEHVEDRIRDHYDGKENIWLKQLSIK